MFCQLSEKEYIELSPPPSSLRNDLLLLQIHVPVEDNKHPNFEWRGGGRVWIVLFSKVIPFEDNDYTCSLSPIAGPTVYMYISTVCWHRIALMKKGNKQTNQKK